MKKFIYILLAAVTLVGCDVIADGDRIIPVEVKVGERRVLLEEFTGYRCMNCPTAAEIAHDLIKLYGENMVVVALHPDGSYWTRPTSDPAYVDLRSEAATTYFEYYGSPAGFPIGMINRTSFDGSVLQNYPVWMTYVNQQLVIDPEMTMSLTATVDSDSRAVELLVSATLKEEFNGKVNLQLFLLESGIVSPQVMQDGKENPNYVHNHVLRDAINGVWGQEITLPGLDQTVDITYTYTVSEDYNMTNCSVVAFLYHTETKQVIQAYEVEL